MENDLVFTRPAGSLTLTILMRWLGQDLTPSHDALDWSPELDHVAIVTSVEATDAEGTRVLPGYWGLSAYPAAWQRYADGVTRKDRGADAQAVENAARAAVSDLIAAVDQARVSHRTRQELRQRRLAEAGVPTWLRSAGGGREKLRGR